MAKNLSTALGTDLASIAQLLRSKGRGKDSILAHINPREAALLKRAGGSGTINPETGLPEFQEDYGYDSSEDYSSLSTAGTDFTPEENAMYGYTGANNAPYFDTNVEPVTTRGYTNEIFTPAGSTGEYTGEAMGGPATIGPATAFGLGGREVGVASGFQMTPDGQAVEQIPEPQPSILDRAGKVLGKAGTAIGDMKPETLGRLGLAGGLGLIGAFQNKRQGQQAQAATAEQKAIAQPYTEVGQKLMTQAQAGQLTPQSQASLDAAKARIAQSVASRGGVGQQQSANQIAQIYNNLLDNQFKYGLQVAQIGDNIALGAIRTGLQMDRQMATNTQNFYTQLAQIAGGGTYGYAPPTVVRGA
jgi:hypothetical protein